MHIEISLARGTVRVGDETAQISGHTLALALYLAAENRPVSRTRIAAALFHADSRERENAVKVYVHRLRTVIGKGTVVRTADAYGYSDAVYVDLPALEAFLNDAEDGALHDQDVRAHARQLLARVACRRPDTVLRWKWFGPVERRLRTTERRLRALCGPVVTAV